MKKLFILLISLIIIFLLIIIVTNMIFNKNKDKYTSDYSCCKTNWNTNSEEKTGDGIKRIYPDSYYKPCLCEDRMNLNIFEKTKIVIFEN